MNSGVYARRLAATVGVGAIIAAGAITASCADDNRGTGTTDSTTQTVTGTEKSIISSVTSWLSTLSSKLEVRTPTGGGAVRG